MLAKWLCSIALRTRVQSFTFVIPRLIGTSPNEAKMNPVQNPATVKSINNTTATVAATATATATINKEAESSAVDLYAMRLRGLPFQVTADQIAKFFQDIKPLPGSIKIGTNRNGERTGFAVVRFASGDDLTKAQKKYQCKNLGNRWIELFLIDKKSYEEFDSK